MGEQNWLAVGLDFFIVVLGVFIGIQLGNWNDARTSDAAYEAALERYRAEIAVNLETLKASQADTLARLQDVGRAIDQLSACDTGPEARATINQGINKAMGTGGLSIRRQALDELTSSPALLAEQDEAARQRFGETAHIIGVFLREADYAERLPLDKRLQDNPVIEVGPLARRDVTYYGADYSRRDRRLQLAVPVNEACLNDGLIKDLYSWERWQAALPAIAEIVRARLEEDLAWLSENS